MGGVEKTHLPQMWCESNLINSCPITHTHYVTEGKDVKCLITREDLLMVKEGEKETIAFNLSFLHRLLFDWEFVKSVYSLWRYCNRSGGRISQRTCSSTGDK